MKRILILLVSTILLFSFFTVFSKPNPNSTSTFNKLQSAAHIGQDPGASAELVKLRLDSLASRSGMMDMPYNSTVQSYIDQYLKNGRRQLTELLVRCAYYMPIFEKALQEAGLPDELKYVAVIESSLKLKATSPRGASGFWQFMPATAKGYDMKITSAIDERWDPYLSSERACRLLKKQYERFGDWALALAAYNAGQGTVQKAIRRAGLDKSSATFQAIAQYLPAETRKYVPKFIAMNYIMKYYTRHNISEVPVGSVVETDTIHISEKMNLSQIAGVLEVPTSQLRDLNPHFRTDMIPATAERPCNLILPVEHIETFKESRSEILSFRKSQSVASDEEEWDETPVTKKVTQRRTHSKKKR